MPTNKPRVTITMTEQELGAIEDYQYFNNKKNQTQAILDLIRKGLDEAEAASTEISAEELAHIKNTVCWIHTEKRLWTVPLSWSMSA